MAASTAEERERLKRTPQGLAGLAGYAIAHSYLSKIGVEGEHLAVDGYDDRDWEEPFICQMQWGLFT